MADDGRRIQIEQKKSCDGNQSNTYLLIQTERKPEIMRKRTDKCRMLM